MGASTAEADMALKLPVLSAIPAIPVFGKPPRPSIPPPPAIVRRGRYDDGFFETPDGTELYFRVDGERGPWVVLCNGLGVSTFFWEPLRDAFKSHYRVVTWDYRSHGRSGPAPKEGFGIATCAEDLRALLDHLAIETAVLGGHSMGTQVIFEAWRRFPERIAGLVPVLGGMGRTVETFFNTRLSLEALRLGKKVALANKPIAQAVVRAMTRLPVAFEVARAIGVVNRSFVTRDDFGPYLDHLAKFDLAVYFQLAEDLQAHDARDVLPTIAVPTLVVAGDKDLFTPAAISEQMAKLIPGAELLVVRGGSHAALVEQPELIHLRLERFLYERLGMPRIDLVA